jgi:hypothetical protein
LLKKLVQADKIFLQKFLIENLILVYKLMETGAKLQAEAAQIGKECQAVINIHQKGQVRQEVQVEALVVPPPSELHVLQSCNVV